jgi:hypothetical protein
VPPLATPGPYNQPKKFDPPGAVNPTAPAIVVQPPVGVPKIESLVKNAPPKVEKEVP